MAGSSMNDIKARIKSVQSTMQITKAMELVATSKLRRAKERAESSHKYHELLGRAISDVASTNEAKHSLWAEEREDPKTLYVAIAGDRGLAGGYNSSIFKMTEAMAKDGRSALLPIGKKAVEYFSRRNYEIFDASNAEAADFGVGDSMKIGEAIANAFTCGKIDRVVLVYTRFVSMMTQLPTNETLLPISPSSEEKDTDAMFDGDPEDFFAATIPQYLGGIIFSSVCEAVASESASRRSAMNSANKNAGEIIDTLMLKYNRARQAVITQEITEIVSGADALG